MSEDALAGLVVDEEDLARTELAAALAPFVRFSKRGDVLLQPAFDQLTSLRKVECLLLAFKAAQLLGLREHPGASPQELVAASGMAGGTVRPKLTELSGLRLVNRDGKEYVLAPHSMQRVARELLGALG